MEERKTVTLHNLSSRQKLICPIVLTGRSYQDFPNPYDSNERRWYPTLAHFPHWYLGNFRGPPWGPMNRRTCARTRASFSQIRSPRQQKHTKTAVVWWCKFYNANVSSYLIMLIFFVIVLYVFLIDYKRAVILIEEASFNVTFEVEISV